MRMRITMLFDINRRRVTNVPHEDDYRRWRAALPDVDFRAIWSELDGRVGSNDILTSSWMPGNNWEGTVFQPMYDRACNNSFEQAGWFFGLTLWDVIMNRREAWCFIKDPDGNIRGTTYFRAPDLD
jgi:hypothetical protein